ncbi:MAG: glycosyltransferase [Actinomycetia bacterium]|nr:glycosyltransferase [Actinomycetes bacterium]
MAFTIVAHNYIPRAQIVADSFIEHHPGAAFYIVVTDYPLQVRNRQSEDPRLVPITDIDFGDEGFELMATFYDVMEFATAVKPFALKHFLRSATCVLYLDPDIEVYAPLDPLVDATRRAAISFTPHCLEPIERDGCQPSEAGIMMAGVYNLGYVGVAKGAESFLDWWSSRLRRDAISDPSNHIFTDQRWIDLCIPLFRPHIEPSPSYNVAYWNLDQRPVRREAGSYWINDEPLRFFHFSGYDPNKPHWISKHQPSSPRVVLSDHPVLVDLFNEYGTKLLAHTGAESPLPYGWSQPIPGLTSTKELRRAFRAEVLKADAGEGAMPPSPFRCGGPEQFIKWMAEPAPGAALPLPRYLEAIWAVRPDLQKQMPEVAQGDFTNMRLWVHNSGAGEYEMLALIGWLPSDANTGVPWHEAGATEHGVNLVGYLTAELGVGESARLTAAALRAAGVGVATVTTTRTTSRLGVEYPADNVARYDTLLMGVNADQTDVVQADLGASFVADRYVIGQWYWELEEFPTRFHSAFELVDEVWAATEFIRDAIAKVAPPTVTVTHVPIPLATPVFDPELTRESLGLPSGFMFLFAWDMLSVLDRKNPEGLITAYRTAFSPTDGAVLVLKTMHGRANFQGLERLRWACRDRPDIIVIDEVFDQVRAGSLTNVCDCYVSLHRSEGLGLTMAEAMLLEKPVIATGYSGNLDFTAADVSHLVRWNATTVPASAGGYRTGSKWADPDLAHAAELMRTVFDNRENARQLGVAARVRLLETHSLEQRGAAMRRRLEEIWSN